ncbi:GFA family protein [Lichenibacterium dinghuense]|uniref:GFA family protein n=1 Tax=Lichenibacterium dinghuense TaxID=2895977 RepID=UPI001F48F647|nr:GFA family protein [Lichenibacterium sp. 6Y81]
MPLRLEGSCHCGAVRFALDSHTPQPYQRCYCTVCRKTAGGGGFAINIMGVAASLAVEDPDGARRVYRAEFVDAAGERFTSSAERSFCSLCAAALWLWDPRWPELIHPFASAVDTALPVPPEGTHILLESRAPWVVPQLGAGDACFDDYPAQSIEEWHRARGLWVE